MPASVLCLQGSRGVTEGHSPAQESGVVSINLNRLKKEKLLALNSALQNRQRGGRAAPSGAFELCHAGPKGAKGKRCSKGRRQLGELASCAGRLQ